MTLLTVALGAALSIVQAGTVEGWHGTIVDASGAAIANAHIYERAINSPAADAPVVHVAESDKDGHFVLPLVSEAKHILIFAAGFKPWTGFITAESTGYHSLRVSMQIVPCNYPGVNCDTFAVPSPRLKKH